MRLLLPTLFLCLYATLSFALPLRWHWAAKTGAILVLLTVSMKYMLYEQFGGSFFAPKLPLPMILTMETLFAALVVLVFLLAVKDMLGLVLWLGRQLGVPWSLPGGPGVRNGILLGLALLSAGWGTWEAVKVPEVHTVEITLPGLPAGLDGATIVQLTDLHVWPLARRDWLQQVVDATNRLNPDIIVITGDLIDALPDEIENEVEPYGHLQARYGVYGVNGNHEFYYQAEAWAPVFRRMGIDMLHNEHRVLTINGEQIALAGVPDVQERRFGGEGPDVVKAFQGVPDTVRILLDHRPGKTANGLADLQLSGHTHGGQMFFLQPLIALFNDGLVHGLYKVGSMQVYVSPGTGLWVGFSSRVGVPAEITRIVLRTPAIAAQR